MSLFFYSTSRWRPFDKTRYAGLFFPVCPEIAQAMGGIGEEAEPLPAVLLDRVRVERRFVLSRTQDTITGTPRITEIVTRLTRLRAGRLPSRQNWSISRRLDPGEAVWQIIDETGEVVHEVRGVCFYAAYLFSSDPSNRIIGMRGIATNATEVRYWLDSAEEGNGIAERDGVLHCASIEGWTPEELAPLLCCPDREIRQRVRLLIGQTANRQAQEQKTSGPKAGRPQRVR